MLKLNKQIGLRYHDLFYWRLMSMGLMLHGDVLKTNTFGGSSTEHPKLDLDEVKCHFTQTDFVY
jgi:hypothetical protein